MKGLGIARFVVHDALYGPSEAIRNSWGPHRIKGTEGMQFDEKSKKAQLSQSAGCARPLLDCLRPGRSALSRSKR